MQRTPRAAALWLLTTLTALVGVVAPAGPAHAVTATYWFQFTKNAADQTNSRLYLVEDPGTGHAPYTLYTWRAGSGQTENPCQTNYGWLPNGTYSITAAYLNHIGTVEGPALQLSDHKCNDGTLRTELFIHSSYPWSSSHYYSNGCIKASNTGGPSPASGDIQAIYNQYANHKPGKVTVG